MQQPNATLVVHGYQTILSRESDTAHRGWMAIYADAEIDREHREMLDQWPVNDCIIEINNSRIFKGWPRFMRTDLGWPSTKVPDTGLGEEIAAGLPKGAIVGIVYLAKTERSNGITERWNRLEGQAQIIDPDYNDVTGFEPVFGDYTNGRYIYWLCSPIALRTPIKVDGWPSMWDTSLVGNREFNGLEHQIRGHLQNQGSHVPVEAESAIWRLANRRGVSDGRPINA